MKINKPSYRRMYLFGLLISLLVLVFYVIVQQRIDEDVFESAVLSDYAGYVARVLTDEVKNGSSNVGQLFVLRDMDIEVASGDLKDLTLPLPIVKSDQLEDMRRYLEGKPGNFVVQDNFGITRYIGIIQDDSRPREGLLVRVTPKNSLFHMSRLWVPVLLPFIVLMVFWSVTAILTQQNNLIASNRANLNLSAELKKATQNAEDCLHGPVQASYFLIISRISELSAEFPCLQEMKEYINEVSYPLRGYMRYFRELGENVPVIPMFAYYLYCVDLLVGCRCNITSFLPSEEEAEHVLRNNAEAKIALQMNLYDAVQNAITHAEAQNIEVRMEISGSATTLIVEDDGKGFDLEKVLGNREFGDDREHYGLEHFLRRARYFDEEVKDSQVIRASPGKGCRISLRIPQKTNAKQKIYFRRFFAILQNYIRSFCTSHISERRRELFSSVVSVELWFDRPMKRQ